MSSGGMKTSPKGLRLVSSRSRNGASPSGVVGLWAIATIGVRTAPGRITLMRTLLFANAHDFGVSVITIRDASRTLVEDGLIQRQQGRGTFVSDLPRHLGTLNASMPLHLLYSQNFGEETEILERAIVPVPLTLRRHFPERETLALSRRLERREGRPRSYAVQHFWSELDPRIDDETLRRQTMLSILPPLGVTLKRIELDLQARLASTEIGRILEIDSTAAIMQATIIGYDGSDRAVNVMQISLAGDRFTYHVHMEPSHLRAP